MCYENPRKTDRYTYGMSWSDISSSSKWDSPNRKLYWKRIFKILAPLWSSHGRWEKNVEITWELLYAQRYRRKI